MRNPDHLGLTGKSRDRLWPFAIFAGVALLVASIFLVAILLRPAVPPTPTRSASAINVQASDLGTDWGLPSQGYLTGPAGLIGYSFRSYHRDSTYGGTVYVTSAVEMYSGPENASNRYAEIAFNASKDVAGTAADVGDHGLLFETNKSVSLLFRRSDTVVWMSVYWGGSWEDLTGRAFSAEYRAAGDLLVLAHIVDSRI